jgi:hypothetical protein
MTCRVASIIDMLTRMMLKLLEMMIKAVMAE